MCGYGPRRERGPLQERSASIKRSMQTDLSQDVRRQENPARLQVICPSQLMRQQEETASQPRQSSARCLCTPQIGREGGHQAPLQWHRTPSHGLGEPRGDPGRVPCTAPSGPPACLPCCTCRGEARRSRHLVGTGEKIHEATAPRNSSAHPLFAAAHAKHTHPAPQRRVPGARSGSVT